MSGMFDNYNNPLHGKDCEEKPLPTNKPEQRPCSCVSNRPNKPFESYNEKGDVIGYWWYEGDTIALEFTIDGEIIIDQKVVENINGEDVIRIVPTYIPVEDFIKNKVLTFTMYNFRGEPIITKDFESSLDVAFNIDGEYTKLLTKGSYTVSLTLWDGETFNKTIYSKEDCVITIK